MLRQRARSIIATVVLAFLAFASLGAWAVSSPTGSSPDEGYHLASIWCSLGDREDVCAPGDTATERTVEKDLTESHKCYAQDSRVSAGCIQDFEGTTSTEFGNFLGSYPPVFYATLGMFASERIAVSTVIMRLFNAALFVGLATWLILALGKNHRGPFLWATTLSMIPLGMFIVPSLNPSSWAVISASGLWLALLGYFKAENWKRRSNFIALSVILAIMGAGARGDSAAYVALAALIAMVLTFVPRPSWWKRAILPISVIALGAAFFLFSGQSTGIAGVGRENPPLTPGNVMGNILYNLPQLQSIWVGNMGTWGLGWLDTDMAPGVWVTMIALFSGVAFHGLRVLDKRKGISLLLVIAALIFIPMYVFVREQIHVGTGVQPRYVLPLMFLFIGVSVYGFANERLQLTRLQGLLVFAGAAIANSIALHQNLRRYITGSEYTGLNLNHNIEWWWLGSIQPMMVWAGGAIAFALLMYGLFRLIYGSGSIFRDPVVERPAVEPQSLVEK